MRLLLLLLFFSFSINQAKALNFKNFYELSECVDYYNTFKQYKQNLTNLNIDFNFTNQRLASLTQAIKVSTLKKEPENLRPLISLNILSDLNLSEPNWPTRNSAEKLLKSNLKYPWS